MAIAVADRFARPQALLSGLDASTTLEHFALVTLRPSTRTGFAAVAAAGPDAGGPDARRRPASRVRLRGVVPGRRLPVRDRAGAAGLVLPDELPGVRHRARRRTRGLLLRHDARLAAGRGPAPTSGGCRGTGGATRIDAEWDADGRCVSYRPRVPRRLGRGDRRARGARRSPPAASTASPTPTTRRSSSPTRSTAGSRQPDGRLGRYEVWHDRLTPQIRDRPPGALRRLRAAGSRRRGPAAHSVLLQRAVEFDVHLPPTTPL